MFKVPEDCRIKTGQFASKENDLFGVFKVRIGTGIIFGCIATDGDETHPWEHVSITLYNRKFHMIKRTPTWKEMCIVKSLFWDDDDVVIQIHPKASDHVNLHNYCLHLWRKKGENIETPPKNLIG